MISDERLSRFITLFGGNLFALGTEQGGCKRIPVTDDAFHGHLDGGEPIGIYPMVYANDSWVVRWGCVDLDVKADHKRRWDYDTPDDAWIAALNLRTALSLLHLEGWIESTKSGGFHVWVFAEDWVPAAHMRRALLVACSLVDVPPTEVNPKNEQFEDPTTLGNYVRLPYPAWFQSQINRPMIDSDRLPTSWVEFVDQAWETRARPADIEAAAALWSAPKRTVQEPARDSYVHYQTGGMSRRLRAVIENGPLKAEDRSGWLFYVARLCQADGLSPSEAAEVVHAADDAHTRKYTERHDGATQIARTVEKAYS